MASSLKSLGNVVGLTQSGKHGVWAKWRSKRWREIGKRRVRTMQNLDKAKVEWIVCQKRSGAKNASIAASMGISVRWVQKLWARYKDKDAVAYPEPMGRPPHPPPGRREHSAILSGSVTARQGAASLEDVIKSDTGMNISHYSIHKVLRDADLAKKHPNKSRRRKWVRYERTYSNSMWHTDYKQLDDGRWFLCYEDDASRFVTGYGVFEHATTENALAVLDEAIKKHGKPASILTDRGSQFYASESDIKKKGVSEFEKTLVKLDIKHILARVKHPQTNGKIERLHGEIQRKLPLFEEESAENTVRGAGAGSHVGGPFNSGSRKEPIERFMDWYNYQRAHQSLDWDSLETPARAFLRKMPPKDAIVVDEQTGEEYST